MSDILHRFVCSKCKKKQLDFSKPDTPCCGEWQLEDHATTVAMTTGVFGSQYDSVDTLDMDVDAYREQDTVEREWKEIEESRRQ